LSLSYARRHRHRRHWGRAWTLHDISVRPVAGSATSGRSSLPRLPRPCRLFSGPEYWSSTSRERAKARGAFRLSGMAGFIGGRASNTTSAWCPPDPGARTLSRFRRWLQQDADAECRAAVPHSPVVPSSHRRGAWAGFQGSQSTDRKQRRTDPGASAGRNTL